MRKLEIADPEVMRNRHPTRNRPPDESRYDHRLHGLLLVTGGHSCQQVAELFGEDRRTVQRWVKRFESHGLKACARANALAGRRHWTLNNGGTGARLETRPWGIWPHRSSVGRQVALRAPAQALWRRFGRASVPTDLRANGFPTPEAQTQVAQSDPVKVAAVKNCATWQGNGTLNCGVWTNATSNSTAPDAACGCHRRSRTRC